MTYYTPSSEALITGTAWTNPSYARDSNPSTAAYKMPKVTGLQQEKWLFSSDIVISGNFEIQIDWAARLTATYEEALAEYIPSTVYIAYSWDGNTWSDLFLQESTIDGNTYDYGPHTTGFATYTVNGAGHNLNTLQVKVEIYTKALMVDSVSIYEIRANAAGAVSASGKKILRCRPT